MGWTEMIAGKAVLAIFGELGMPILHRDCISRTYCFAMTASGALRADMDDRCSRIAAKLHVTVHRQLGEHLATWNLEIIPSDFLCDGIDLLVRCVEY